MQGGSGPLCKNCHDPLPTRPTVNIYLDKVFGSFMFQDVAAPAPPGIYVCCLSLIRALLQQEASTPRFSDLSAEDPARGEIGLLAKFGVLPGVKCRHYLCPCHAAYAAAAYRGARGAEATVRGRACARNSAAPAGSAPASGGANPDVRTATAGVNVPSVNPPATSPALPTVTRQEFALALAQAFALPASPDVKVKDVGVSYAFRPGRRVGGHRQGLPDPR